MGFIQDAFRCASPQKRRGYGAEYNQADNECDYHKNPTQLYQLLEAKSWPQALEFLVEGIYASSVIKNDTCRIPYNKQASIWVTRYERDGSKIKWSHIPLHAAIIFGAPYKVVKKLIELYPDGVRCADDQAMLPLHLAFKHLTHVHILRLIMDEFPDALFTKDHRGRLPSDIRQDERSVIIQRVISVATSRVKQQTENRDTKEITELRKALLEQNREVRVDEDTARRHREQLQERDGMIEVLRNKIHVLQFEIQNLEKKSTYSFPFMNTEAGQDCMRDPGFQLRKIVGLQSENEELKEKVNALEKELATSTTALRNLQNQKNTIRIGDEDTLRFTELSDGMLQEKNKYEQEKRKNNVLEAENKRLKDEMARMTAGMSAMSHRMYEGTVSSGNSSAENRAPNKERFQPTRAAPAAAEATKAQFPRMKMATVGIGSKDLESFLETRLLQELDVENRRLEKQLAANNKMDVGALLRKQSRLQEMEREVKHFQGHSQQRFGDGLAASRHEARIDRYNRKQDDAFIDEYNRARSRVGGRR